jgi:hypothetical protein
MLVLAACTTAGNEPAVSVNDPAGDQSTATEILPATDTPTDVPADDENQPVEEVEAASDPASTEVTILTEDNRSDRLRSLTRSWNTNWNRRTIEYDEILSGGPPRDGIPSIDDPQFISQDEAAEWLPPVEPVIAVEINGDARAYPLQILTWHEIVNDTVGDVPVAVTFCPLCNSALTFDRRFDGQVFAFGTSGLLRNSDLIMYDRTTETLWQQFTGAGIVGDLAGEQLTFVPSILVSFNDFQEAYPEGVVLSRDTGFNRRYGENPYAGYDTIGRNPFLFDGELDGRLPAVARVVTVSFPDVDVAYPYTTLSEVGVINDSPAGHDLVVFWEAGTTSALGAPTISEAEDVGATAVYEPFVDGEKLTFTVEDGQIVDENTGSTWNLAGQATAGPLAGTELTRIVSADHFWFSWAAFRPDTIIYGLN